MRTVCAAVCVVATVVALSTVGAFAPSCLRTGCPSYGSRDFVFGTTFPKVSCCVIKLGGTSRSPRPLFSQRSSSDDEEEDSSSSTRTATLSKEGNEKTSPLIIDPKIQALRDQARRARLDAENLDLQLTMEKLGRLQRELERNKQDTTGKNDTKDLTFKIENLQRKLRGEPPIANIAPPVAPSNTTTTLGAVLEEAATVTNATETVEKESSAVPLGRGIDLSIRPFDQELYDNITNIIADLQKEDRSLELRLLATNVGLVNRELNVTEIAVRTEMKKRGDFSFFTNVPTEIDFQTAGKTEEEDEFEEMITSIMGGMLTNELLIDVDVDYMDDELKEKIAFAEEFYLDYLDGQMDDDDIEEFASNFIDDLLPLITGDNYAEQFPPCIDKEGRTPTEEQANAVLDILPAAGFTATSKPSKVLGGYAISGQQTTPQADGNALVRALDEQVAQSDELRGKVTLCLVEDLSAIDTNEIEDMDELLLSTRNAIYVLGPEVGGDEPKPVVQASAALLSVLGAWGLSLYPTLLSSNQNLLDPSVLTGTEASHTIFAVFLACLLAHEVAHGVVAGVLKLETNLPTLVPGMPSITTFKAPPKNRQQLFDFAFAGPVVGMMVSFAALVQGCQLTVDAPVAAANLFPELPLSILRESTFGGAIIEWFCGAGTLTIPAGAEEQMAGTTLGLHPVAIAGFMGLFVNALAMLPVGVTDGGRVAETVLGRSGKGTVGFLTLAALFGSGIFAGNELLFAYGLFCYFTQLGKEIPSRNDLDDISFPRVLAATAGVLTAVLVLFPIQ